MRQLLATASDRDNLEDTYDEWLRAAHRTLLDLMAQGVVARKVDVSVDAMQSWCREQQVPFDSAARADYVSHQLVHGQAKRQAE
jgi:hypothetical protein